MTTIIEGDGIYAFGLLQHYYRMKLTLETGLDWRVNSFEIARDLLEKHGYPRPTRSRQKTFDAYKQMLTDMGIEPKDRRQHGADV